MGFQKPMVKTSLLLFEQKWQTIFNSRKGSWMISVSFPIFFPSCIASVRLSGLSGPIRTHVPSCLNFHKKTLLTYRRVTVYDIWDCSQNAIALSQPSTNKCVLVVLAPQSLSLCIWKGNIQEKLFVWTSIVYLS